MSTYANVEIEGRHFSVTSDGGDKEGIRDAVRQYVKEAKGKVKPDYLARVVVDTIASESAGDFYAPFQLGYCEFPSYAWRVEIGIRGGIQIRGGRIDHLNKANVSPSR